MEEETLAIHEADSKIETAQIALSTERNDGISFAPSQQPCQHRLGNVQQQYHNRVYRSLPTGAKLDSSRPCSQLLRRHKSGSRMLKFRLGGNEVYAELNETHKVNNVTKKLTKKQGCPERGFMAQGAPLKCLRV